MRTAFILVLLIGLPWCLAGTYYVSPTGSASWSNCINEAAPCSLATANSNAKAGDIIYLKEGTYTTEIAPAASGTQAGRITYRANGRAIITGVSNGINLFGKSYVTVDGITVSMTATFADLRQAEHIWIHNSILVNCTNIGGWPMGVKMYDNSRYNWLANSTIGNCGYFTSDDDKGGVMNIGHWQYTADTTSHNLLENNRLFHGGHHVIEINSRYNVFRNNTFHNENSMPCQRASTGNLCGNRNIGLYDIHNHSTYNLFEGNRFAFSGASIDDRVGASGASIRSTNNIIRNNMFYLNDGPGITLYADRGDYYNARYNYIYNNVLYKNAISPLQASDYRYGFGLVFDNTGGTASPWPIRNVSVKNNMFYDHAVGDIFFYYTEPAEQTLLQNYFRFARGSNAKGYFDPSTEGNSISTDDPLFVDISPQPVPANIERFDFRLQYNSPAIDAGTFLTHTTASGAGKIIPVRDAGYFTDGFGIVEGDVIQLENQSESARIVSIDYSQNLITVDTNLVWEPGQGVSLEYSGLAPDIGAHEYPSGFVPVCGDGVCQMESCLTCPEDCGQCPTVCGDGICENGETCSSCPADCGICPAVCGNGMCDNGETCSSCPADCKQAHQADNDPCDGCISNSELMAYLQLWKTTDIPINSLIGAVRIWKEGCG